MTEATRGAQTDRPTIRRAEAGDVDTLHALLAAMSEELAAPAFRSDPATLSRHGFGDAPLFRALIAEARGEAVGMGLYFPEFSTLRGRPGVYIQDLYVAPPARGTGLGRRLLAAAARDARDWGAAYMRLSAHAGNESALVFYRRLGFATDPAERLHWIEGTALEKLGETE